MKKISFRPLRILTVTFSLLTACGSLIGLKDQAGTASGEGEAVTLSGYLETSAVASSRSASLKTAEDSASGSDEGTIPFTVHTLEGEDLATGATDVDGFFSVSVLKSDLSRQDGEEREHVVFIFGNGIELMAEVPVDENSSVGVADATSTNAVYEIENQIEGFIDWGEGYDYRSDIEISGLDLTCMYEATKAVYEACNIIDENTSAHCDALSDTVSACFDGTSNEDPSDPGVDEESDSNSDSATGMGIGGASGIGFGGPTGIGSGSGAGGSSGAGTGTERVRQDATKNISGVYTVSGSCDSGNRWNDTHWLDCTGEATQQACTIKEASQPNLATLILNGRDCSITHPFNTVTSCYVSGSGSIGTVVQTLLAGGDTACREIYVKTSELSKEVPPAFSGTYSVTGRCAEADQWTETTTFDCAQASGQLICTVRESSQPDTATIVINGSQCSITHPFNTVTACSIIGSGSAGTFIETTLKESDADDHSGCSETYLKMN